MDEHLDGLSALVHERLKRLKMDEQASITCTKEFPGDEVRLYVTAYAMHKKKWFLTEYDKATNTVKCKRAPEPDWEAQNVVDEEEEL
jgi:hypothetical protein